MVVMSVRCEAEVWNYRAEMKHRRQLYSQLARRMYCDAKLKSLTNARRFNARSDTTPESCIKKNYINRCIEDLSLIHISEPTRLLSISYAVFCLKKKKKKY